MDLKDIVIQVGGIISGVILIWYILVFVVWFEFSDEDDFNKCQRILFIFLLKLLFFPVFLPIESYKLYKLLQEEASRDRINKAEKLLNLEVEELIKEINDCISSWDESLEAYLLVSSLFSKVLRFEEKYGLTTLDKLKEKLSDLTIKFENR